MLFLIASVLIIQTAYASSVTITNLGKLTGMPDSQAFGINDKGQIVGNYADKTGYEHAILWKNGKITDLGILPGALDESSAQGINDKGQIVGTCTYLYGINHGFLWQNSVMTDLGTLPGGSWCIASDINNNGQIVGASNDASGYSHAFSWKNGKITNLGTLSGGWSSADSINDKGQIVGSSGNASGYNHAVLWQNGKITDLGTLPGGLNSFADCINDNGQIVGSSADASGYSHAVLWQNGKITDLGKLSGSVLSSATSINNAGQIVGYCGYEPDNPHACVWQNGKITDLGMLPGDTFSFADDINNAGQIVGQSGNVATLWTITNNSVLPKASFTSNTTSGYAPLSVKFTDQSSGSPTSWKWTFGDESTSTAQNPTHKYTKTGKYTVSLTVKNAKGSNTKTIKSYITVKTASLKPVAAFTASPTSGSKPLVVTFTDKSTNNPTSWKWDFGDGTTSTTHNPIHTYIKTGSHTVTLTATNSAGSNTATKTNYIKVTNAVKPVAAFSASPTSGTKPLKVQFTDKSTGSPTSWKWDFGDGTTSTTHNPLHTYIKKGKLTVKLTVKNTAGSSTKTISNYITVK